MRKQPIWRSVAATLALALAVMSSSPGNPALAQMKYDDFLQYDDYFPESYYPMTELEQKLFEQIKGYPERSWNEYSRFPLPPSGALISVKISKQQNVLVNLHKEFRPQFQEFGDEEFYHQFRRIAVDTAGRLLGRENGGSDSARGLPPIHLYWVFEGKTAFAKQYQRVVSTHQP